MPEEFPDLAKAVRVLVARVGEAPLCLKQREHVCERRASRGMSWIAARRSSSAVMPGMPSTHGLGNSSVHSEWVRRTKSAVVATTTPRRRNPPVVGTVSS